MKSALKIIKINCLSLIALPLMLLATATKLVSRAVAKILMFIGMMLAIWAVSLLFEFLKNPGEGFKLVLIIIAIFVLFGVFIWLIIAFFAIISAVFTATVSFLAAIFEFIHEAAYSAYIRLYEICKRDFQSVGNGSEGFLSRFLNGLLCLFFTLTAVINKIVVFFFMQAFKISLLCSATLVGLAYYYFDASVKKDFGLSLFSYIGLFKTFDMIYGVVMFSLFMISAAAVIILLGTEWSGWGKELKLATSDYDEYCAYLSKNIATINSSPRELTDFEYSGQDAEKCRAGMELLFEHSDSYGDFLEHIYPILAKVDDTILRMDLAEYTDLLGEIASSLSSYGNVVPLEVAGKQIPDINRVDKLKREILKRAEKLNKYAVSEPKDESRFFTGCDTKEKLEKRYRSLCKTYHPDIEAGDEETFKIMKDEYDKLSDVLK